MSTAYFAKALAVEVQQILTVEPYFAGIDFAGRGRNQTQNAQGGDGFAAAGLTHQADGLSCRQVKTDTINRPGNTFRGVEVHGQVFYFKQFVVHVRMKSVFTFFGLM
jgi:hypothetical protein